MAKSQQSENTGEPTPTAEPDKKKKARIAKKVYIASDGSEGKYPSPETIGAELRFEDGAGTLLVDIVKVGEGCRVAGQWHGVLDKIANAYNKAKDPAEAFVFASAMLERLYEDEWVKPGTVAGASTNLLVLAVVRCIEAEGGEIDDERRGTIRAKVTGKENRENALNNPKINAMFKTIQAEEAIKRADTAAAEAKGSDASLSAF